MRLFKLLVQRLKPRPFYILHAFQTEKRSWIQRESPVHMPLKALTFFHLSRGANMGWWSSFQRFPHLPAPLKIFTRAHMELASINRVRLIATKLRMMHLNFKASEQEKRQTTKESVSWNQKDAQQKPNRKTPIIYINWSKIGKKTNNVFNSNKGATRWVTLPTYWNLR